MAGTRSALIVANDQYDDPGLRRLRAPGQDAQALARVLGDPAIGGFEVRTVTNEPEHRLRREIGTFFANRRRDDLLLAHFSCHGVKDDEGQLFFATANTELGSLDTTAVSAEFVNRQMTRSQSRRVVLLLDCCYSGAFARGLLARADTGVDLRDRFKGRGRIVLTASSAMEYAFEDAELSAGRGRPSVFTRALVQGLETGDADRNGDGFVSVDELYDYVFEEVSRAAPKQTPGRWDFEMHGELLVARTPAPRAVPLPSELRQALDHPFSAVRVAAVEELKRLLRGDHAGFTLAAAAALQELTRDDSQRVASAAAAALASSRGSPHAPAADRPVRPEPSRHAAPSGQRPSPSLPAAPRRPAGKTAATATGSGAAPKRPPSPPRPPGSTVPVVKPAASWPRPRPVHVLLVLAVLLLAGVGGWRLLGGSGEVAVGHPFRATSPWRLQVTGRNCAVRVSSSDGRVTSSGHGSQYVLQMRSSGEFRVDELTPGCVASVAAGAGRLVGLPLTLERDGVGTGGDSPPFRSPGGFRVIAEGAGCQTRIHRAADGSQVEELYGTARWEHNQPGSFYVHSDPQCRTRIEAI
jgi:Caspase domain